MIAQTIYDELNGWRCPSAMHFAKALMEIDPAGNMSTDGKDISFTATDGSRVRFDSWEDGSVKVIVLEN